MAPKAQTKKGAATATSTAKKAASRLSDSIQSFTDGVRGNVNKRLEGSSRAAKAQTAEVAVSLIKLQRSTFDKTLKAVAKVQKSTDAAVKKQVEKTSWLPKEGKDIVKEWSRTLEDGRAEFQRTVDRSYDLLRGFFERVAKEQKAAPEAPATPAKKKPAAKKKAAAKRKPSAKSAAPEA